MVKYTKNDVGILDAFRTASRSYSDSSILMHEAIARKAGLSGTDHKYLGLIIQNGVVTAGELSKSTGLTTGAVTGVIDRLEKKKLVKRQFDKDDRRKVIIVPNTKLALKILEPLFTTLQKKTEDLLLSFTKKEIQTIQRYFTEASVILKEITNELNKD